jgi:hypothetical protein
MKEMTSWHCVMASKPSMFKPRLIQPPDCSMWKDSPQASTKKNERTWKHHFDSAVEVCQSNLPSSLLLLSLALHLTAFVAHLPFPMAWEASGSRNVKKLLQMSVTFCIYTTI